MTRIREIEAIVHIELLRSLPGGEAISPEMLLLLSLVVFDDYELFSYHMTRERIPKDWREEYLLVERSSAQMRKDLVAAFDQIHELKLDRRNLRNWLKLLGVVVGIEGAVIGWFATSLLDCIQAAHRIALFTHLLFLP